MSLTSLSPSSPSPHTRRTPAPLSSPGQRCPAPSLLFPLVATPATLGLALQPCATPFPRNNRGKRLGNYLGVTNAAPAPFLPPAARPPPAAPRAGGPCWACPGGRGCCSLLSGVMFSGELACSGATAPLSTRTMSRERGWGRTLSRRPPRSPSRRAELLLARALESLPSASGRSSAGLGVPHRGENPGEKQMCTGTTRAAPQRTPSTTLRAHGYGHEGARGASAAVRVQR